jgi:hypothetical protein
MRVVDAVDFNDSMAALSSAAPTLPIDPIT